MLPEWPLVGSSLLDRDDAGRDSVDLTQGRAVVVRDGAVLLEGESLTLVDAREAGVEVLAYLGRLDGEAITVAVASEAWAEPDGTRLAPLRQLVRAARDRADDPELEIAVAGVALARWHERHPRCAQCGARTIATRAGWVRHCDACGADHYPRTDPAIIVLVTDDDGRALFAHAPHWPEGRYSHVAGYAEPGESLEQAVHREVAEEVGLTVTDVRYVGSQPWPFPASLMVAFSARATSTAIRVDGVEIVDAMWLSEEDLKTCMEEGSVAPPPSGSIAWRLYSSWMRTLTF